MRIHIVSDLAGLELKAALVEYLESKGHNVTDYGPYKFRSEERRVGKECCR